MVRHEHPLHGVSVELGPDWWLNVRPNERPFPGGWRIEEVRDGARTVHMRAVPKAQAFDVFARLLAIRTDIEAGVAA